MLVFGYILFQNSLQNYNKYLEYTRLLAKKYRLCLHKQYFYGKRIGCSHKRANVISKGSLSG